MNPTREGSEADFAVGAWRVRPQLNRVERGDEVRRLEAKSIAVLACLARRPREVVSKQELLDAVWPDTHVGDEVLSHAIWDLRRALGDSAREPEYIETIPKKGYRLIALPPPVATAERTDTTTTNRWLLPLLAGAGVLAGVTLAVAWARFAGADANAGAALSRPRLVVAEITAPSGREAAAARARAALERWLDRNDVPRLPHREGLRRLGYLRPAERRLTSTLARRLARREGLDLVLSGVLRDGAPPRLELVVSDVARDLDQTVSATLSDLEQAEAAIEPLSTDLAALLEPLLARSPPLAPMERVTTASDEAAERLARARVAHRSGDLLGASRLVETALALDPELASGYNLLSIYRSGLGELEESLATSARAWELRSTVSEQERLFIEAHYHNSRLQYAACAESLEKLALLRPRDADVRRRLALAYERLDRYPDAIATSQEAASLAPSDVIDTGLPALLLAATARAEEAGARLRSARERNGDQPYYAWAEALIALEQDDFDGAGAAIAALAAGGSIYESVAALLAAQLEVLRGDLDAAAAVLVVDSSLQERRGHDFNRVLARALLARIRTLQRDRAAALRELEPLRSLAPLPPHLRALRRAAALYAELGRVDLATEVVAEIETIAERYPSETARGIAAEGCIALARARGDLGRARSCAERVLVELRDPMALAAAAKVYLETGDRATAIALLEEIRRTKGKHLRLHALIDWIEGVRLLGEVLTERGDRLTAERVVRSLPPGWRS